MASSSSIAGRYTADSFDGHSQLPMGGQPEDTVERSNGDKGYEVDKAPNLHPVTSSGQIHGLSPTIRRELRQRIALLAAEG